MITSFVRHKVENFDSWKKVYDEFSSIKKEGGVIGASVLQVPDDPNMVIVTHDFESLETANKFFNSDALKNALQNAGVIGKPEIWIGDVREKTPY